MRRSRSPSSTSPFRALAHHQQVTAAAKSSDPASLIRSFNSENNPTRPVRPSPLASSTIRDMPLDLVDRVRSFPLFLSAPEEFLVAIGNHLKPQVHGPNDQIITEGDDAKAMYWLVRGVVAVTSRDGEAVYAELKAGSFFGEIGVLMDMPRTANIVSRTKCLLLVLKKEGLQAVMPGFPDMEKAIREEGQERLNLLKKRQQENKRNIKPVHADHTAREAAPGEVSKGESGSIKDGTVVNLKKRKSPSPGIIEDPLAGSAIGSGHINIRRTLKELPLFSTLPPDILHFLGLSAHPKSCPPFTDIVRQGSPGNEIYFIVRGEAEVVHDVKPAKNGTSSAGASTSVRERPRLRAGQYFGEVSSLGISRGRTATVRSITSVECLVIPGDVLDELWKRCPPDIKLQVEETAWKRYNTLDDDVRMTDAEIDRSNKSEPSTPIRTSLPHVTFTPSKPISPSKDDSEIIDPKDPDPFLSVDMENIRNRRRHSLAPLTPQTEGFSSKLSGLKSPLSDASPVRFTFRRTPSDTEVPAKRVKTLPRRPHGAVKPVFSDDILIRIFRHAEIGTLARLRIISSHWKKLLATSSALCNHVDLSPYNRTLTDQVIVQTLAPFLGTRPESIDISGCFHITDEGFSCLWKTCGKNVKSWKMRSVWDVSASQILEMSENAKGLEEVDWSNCRKVGDNLLGRVVGWVVPEPPPQASKLVVISPAPGKQKGKLHAQQQQQKAQNGPAPGTVIGCPKLNTLDLSYCKHITDRSMAHLAAHASHRLRSLSLTRCTSISDAGFQSWAQFKFEKLTHMCLADCTYLSDNAIVALVNAAKNLTHLDLSFCCALSDTATEVVALGLPKLRDLRLAFNGSAVSDGSLESVALHLSELEYLSVRGCVRVTGKGVESILTSCTQLQWFDVSQCRNLEGWLRAGGVLRWGFDDRDTPPPIPQDSTGQDQDDSRNSVFPPPLSMAMLTAASFMKGPGAGFRGRRQKRPVRFIVEKGLDGLR